MNQNIIQIIIYFFLISSCATAYKYDSYFVKGKEYKYRVLYIDSNNDTITDEIIVMRPLNKRWSGQPRIQESVQYVFETDTNDYKNFISPNPTNRGLDVNYYKKHHIYRVKKSEITGGANKQDYFFLHPPRINQYYMLRYTAFPVVEYRYLTDSMTKFNFHLGEKMKYDHVYFISPLCDSVRSKYPVQNEKLWEMKVESVVSGLTDYWKQFPIFNSKSLLVYSKESGFISMYHNFENGIKIHFDLIEIIQK